MQKAHKRGDASDEYHGAIDENIIGYFHYGIFYFCSGNESAGNEVCEKHNRIFGKKREYGDEIFGGNACYFCGNHSTSG